MARRSCSAYGRRHAVPSGLAQLECMLLDGHMHPVHATRCAMRSPRCEVLISRTWYFGSVRDGTQTETSSTVPINQNNMRSMSGFKRTYSRIQPNVQLSEMDMVCDPRATTPDGRARLGRRTTTCTCTCTSHEHDSSVARRRISHSSRRDTSMLRGTHSHIAHSHTVGHTQDVLHADKAQTHTKRRHRTSFHAHERVTRGFYTLLWRSWSVP
jgi:hypothetical protein